MTHVRKPGVAGAGRAERLANAIHWFGSVVDRLTEQLPWLTPGSLGRNDRSDPNRRQRGKQARRRSGRGPANGDEAPKPLGKMPSQIVLPTPMTADRELKASNFTRAAGALNCEEACIKAVADVESRGSGFLGSNRPKILFEAHIFSKRTHHLHDKSHSEISSKTWNKSLYTGGEKEFSRLEAAMLLDAEAALESASWGRFQIMGFNHSACGYKSVIGFVRAMYESEGKQLDAFVKFLQSQKLAAALREKRWADFARSYNGPGYATNKYDEKLKAAYEKFSSAM